MAQTAKQDSVQARPRPDFTPFGLELDAMLSTVGLIDRQTVERKSSPLSSFIVFPKFELSTSYVSNLFRVEDDPVSDVIVALEPSLEVASDWANHSLALSGKARIGRHVDNVTEDFEDYQVKLAGSLDLSEALKGQGRMGYARRHEPRSDRDDPGRSAAPEPILFTSSTVHLGANYKADAALARFGFDADRLDFDDSGDFDADDRDRIEYGLKARLGYEFVPGTAVFVETGTTLTRYDQERDANGLEQDSQGYRFLVGATWDVTGVVFAEFGAGLLTEEYEEPTYKTETSLNFSGKLIWNPTDLLTVTADLARSIESTRQADVSGVLRTRMSGTVDYGILDNLILTWTVALIEDEFKGSGRKDSLIDTAFKAKYLIDRHWFAGLTVNYENRDSSLAGEDFSNLLLSARIGTQL